MIRVALDGMGGDHAPAAEVEGMALALAELPATFRVQLVGRPEVLEPELAKHPEIDRSRLDVIAAPDVIGMDEKPLQAVRKKPNSSLVVGLALQKAGRSDAYVSAGNTGAVLAASTLMLGLHEGVKRASVATPFPTADGAVLVLDGGANVDCTAAELVGFARLGTVYMRDILGRAEPAVGLLNVGEEDEKGNAAVREAHGLLKQAAGLRYIGNIEGRDILVGHAKWGQIDVVVCDGFVGNVVLKFYESVARLIVRLLKRDAPAILERDDIQKAFRTLDYSEYGGAPLLGVKGVSIIGHGSSGPTAIKNAIRVAVQSVESNLSRHIGEEFARREATASA
ncbi:MAG TPA: phosphate acyltransferase PlsX [Gemmatimonadales bacterium]|nr:phosphate acyltransferase PlsX [Gemmatimonadales bacterium]